MARRRFAALKVAIFFFPGFHSGNQIELIRPQHQNAADAPGNRAS